MADSDNKMSDGAKWVLVVLGALALVYIAHKLGQSSGNLNAAAGKLGKAAVPAPAPAPAA